MMHRAIEMIRYVLYMHLLLQYFVSGSLPVPFFSALLVWFTRPESLRTKQGLIDTFPLLRGYDQLQDLDDEEWQEDQDTDKRRHRKLWLHRALCCICFLNKEREMVMELVGLKAEGEKTAAYECLTGGQDRYENPINKIKHLRNEAGLPDTPISRSNKDPHDALMRQRRMTVSKMAKAELKAMLLTFDKARAMVFEWEGLLQTTERFVLANQVEEEQVTGFAMELIKAMKFVGCPVVEPRMRLAPEADEDRRCGCLGP